MSKSLLVVFGATGQQGGSVIEQLLQDPELSTQYSIRGLTRDPSSPSSQALQQKGVEVVKCETTSDEQVKAALEGATDVFLMTSSIYAPGGGAEEERLGKHLVDMVVESGAKYLIWSSMISPAKLSKGRFTHVDLFESKYNVEQYIRSLPIKSSFFVPASFMQNYHTNSQPRPLGDGTYGLINIIDANGRVPLIDVAADTGKWVVPMLVSPDKYAGKNVAAATKLYSQTEIAEAMSKVTGKTFKHIQVPVQQFESYLPEGTKQIISEMWQHTAEVGYYGENMEEELEWGRKQVKGELTTLEDFLQRNPLKLD